MSVTAAAKQ